MSFEPQGATETALSYKFRLIPLKTVTASASASASVKIYDLENSGIENKIFPASNQLYSSDFKVTFLFPHAIRFYSSSMNEDFEARPFLPKDYNKTNRIRLVLCKCIIFQNLLYRKYH